MAMKHQEVLIDCQLVGIFTVICSNFTVCFIIVMYLFSLFPLNW